MSMHALLAWFGLKAAPHFHDMRVHDALSDDTAVIAGVRCIGRRSQAVARTIVADPDDSAGINKGIEDMRILMAEVAERANR